jgi:LPXTG-motif cell wall-anchored protein
VTVAGTAPRDAEVRVFVGGILQASTHSSATDGSFAATFFLSRTSEIGVSVDDHPTLGCGVDAVGQAAVPGGAQGAAPGGTGSNSGLPRTGGAAVGISAVIGLALALLGSGLVMAARRYDGVRRGS